MRTLALTEQGTRLHRAGELLEVRLAGELLRTFRLGEIGEVALFGEVEVTAAALGALARRGVDVVWLTVNGSFRARLVGPRSPQAALRLAQMRRALDDAFASAVATAMVAGKVAHQRQILVRAQRRLQDDAVAEVLGRMRLIGEECRAGPVALDRLRGLEGQGAALYFSQFGKLLIGGEMAFGGRSRRPPRDGVNACLSFGYTLLGTTVETELLRVGLDPMVGFLHQPDHNRQSLALDVLEEFRPFIDGLVLRLVNRKQLGPGDFEAARVDVEAVLAEGVEGTGGEVGAGEGVYLNATGRRVFLAEYYGRLRESMHYAPRGGAYELRAIVREQAYHLARVIRGEEPEYRAFVPA